jgi:hypothetical protein
MVTPTATSISCCRGPIESKTSRPWPKNSAYAEGVDFGGYDVRIRIARAARRAVERGLSARNRGNPLPSPGAISEAAAIRGELVVSGAEGNFAREFKDARGKIDADLKLGF